MEIVMPYAVGGNVGVAVDNWLFHHVQTCTADLVQAVAKSDRYKGLDTLFSVNLCR